MKTNYADMIGTKVSLDAYGNRNIIGIVAACNYSIGITIVERHSKKEIVCINRQAMVGRHNEEVYDDIFFTCLAMIQGDESVDIPYLDCLQPDFSPGRTATNAYQCAFS